MRPEPPALPGVLSAAEVRRTAASIASVQQADGALPWSAGDQVDVWNHVEAAMALLVGGEVQAADRAYDWCLATQRPDGSWPMRLHQGQVVDPASESNMSAYLAVGVWHHWLVVGDSAFVRRAWPSVRAALDHVVGLQLEFGGVAWAWGAGGIATDALLAGSSSIYQALRSGLALADLAAEPQPDWELAVGRLGHALRRHRDGFADKAAFSMDWYYPVLGGAVRGGAGRRLIAARWDEFVVPGLGVRCVSTNPWVTGAETCELALALHAVGDRAAAHRLVADMQHLRDPGGAYWTGFVYPDDAVWPEEHTAYTAGAVILAVDALSESTGGAGLFAGAGLPPEPPEIALGCGCASVPSSLS